MISRNIEKVCKDFTKIENYELAKNDKAQKGCWSTKRKN